MNSTTLQAENRPEKWTAPIPASRRNYPLNCWWVAAFSDEVGEALLGRWLLDTPVLLYRTAAGRAVAIEDRCPHRAAPLSLGCRKGDEIQCGYHGFTFGPDGACTKIPSMRSVVSTVRVRAFPIIESGPYVWIYLGDPAALDSVPPPPTLDWATSNDFAVLHGRMDVAGNYMLLKENVLDLTHFGYVHASTFGITDWVEPPRVTADEHTVTYHQLFVRSPLPPPFAAALGRAVGTPFNRENYGSFVSPALQVAAVDFIDPENPDPGALAGRFRVAHATTPVDGTHMHYFYLLGRDHGKSPEQMEQFAALSRKGFAEDERIIEAVQAVLSRDPRDPQTLEISVRADSAGVHARRIVQRWMQRET
jgi:phenylpropionate dioxygenase-like ring-hydroxylating dioxygenase large terminal subunit